jgi:membrane-bound lytic murein transglycosylase B
MFSSLPMPFSISSPLFAAFSLVVALALPARADNLRGWGYLVDRLVLDGEARAEVERIFTDPRMPPFDKLEFAPERRPEPTSLYRGFLKPASMAQARACWNRHLSEFQRAQRDTGVPGALLAALLHVESRCGANTGNHRILYRVARLAMAPAPENFRWNLARWLDGSATSPSRLHEQLTGRARYLEETFYPEVRATLELARRWRVDPHELRGSSGGAIGWPQFLPSSVLRFGRDGNGDGFVDLTNSADAILSAAEYLRAYGWRPDLERPQRRQVLWNYNRSFAYVDTLLTLQSRLESGSEVRGTQQRVATAKRATRNGKRLGKSPRAQHTRK